MRTFKIRNGAIRNTNPGNHILAIKKGLEDSVFVSALTPDAVIQVASKTVEGGAVVILTVTLQELLDRDAGL